MRRALPLLPLLLSACAQVGDITGGGKDDTPPRLVHATPAHLNTGFTGDRIVLEFDERVQLDRPRDRMLVSPPLAETPDVRLTGARTVTILLKAPLRANTTYSFAIGEAVKDLTEGNTAAGLTLVFSTGPVLDSLVVAGQVANALTGAAEADALVLLHSVEDTGTVRTVRPSYATRSDRNGTFLLPHLREGDYHLTALRDRNGNYRYDLPNEEIAFLDTPVRAAVPDSGLVPRLLRMFLAESPVQQVREARATTEGALRLVFSNPAAEVDVQDVARTGGQLTWWPEWSPAQDTVLLWPSDTTALGEGRYRITVDGIALDTVRYRRLEKMPFHTGLRVAEDRMAAGTLLVRATRPIATVDPSQVTVLLGEEPVPFQFTADSADQRLARLRTDTDGEAVVLFAPKAVRDIYGGTNDSLRTGFGGAALRNRGSLRVRPVPPAGHDGPWLLQLLDGRGRIVREHRTDTLDRDLVWEALDPGEHRLRLIEDRNANGRWDPGDLDRGALPEPAWQQTTHATVRAAWDTVLDWDPANDRPAVPPPSSSP